MPVIASLPFMPGRAPTRPSALERYLPPVLRDPAAAFLQSHTPAGAWVLDPYGASPGLVVEAARAGRRILVAANNPVIRLLIELAADPPSRQDFQGALFDLGTSRKEGMRLEAHLTDLYLTPCAGCGRAIPAQAFIWNRSSGALTARLYNCPHCQDQGERPARAQDAENAARWAAGEKLHRARAIERVAPGDDPDREYAREAMEAYLPRAVYALGTLINRLDQLELGPGRRRALQALLLTACDAATNLWAYPDEHRRPRQLNLPPQFIEKNVWTALVDGIDLWTGGEALPAVPVTTWPDLPGEGGGICLFEGALRDSPPEFSRLSFSAAVAAIPRPNQAFWTLSALWSGWLWGREAAAPFKAVLRRRRYDWQWHMEALRAATEALSRLLPAEVPFFAQLPEVEPALLTSTLTAVQAAGFDLHGLAVRTAHDPVQLLWRRGEKRSRGSDIDRTRIQQACQDLVRERAEPVPYLLLHAAALAGLASTGGLPWRNEAAALAGAVIRGVLEEAPFERYDARTHPESGLWGSAVLPGLPFSDRVEMAAVGFLQRNPGCSFEALQQAVNAALPGLLTPSLGLLRAVLDSYATAPDGWRLRDEDQPQARRAELAGITGTLQQLAARLGYSAQPAGRAVYWLDGGEAVWCLRPIASAVCGSLVGDGQPPATETVVILPGGRAGLLAHKLRRDPALRQALAGWHFLKFRHLRQIASLPVINRATWRELLRADPLEADSGQMMMF